MARRQMPARVPAAPASRRWCRCRARCLALRHALRRRCALRRSAAVLSSGVVPGKSSRPGSTVQCARRALACVHRPPHFGSTRSTGEVCRIAGMAPWGFPPGCCRVRFSGGPVARSVPGGRHPRLVSSASPQSATLLERHVWRAPRRSRGWFSRIRRLGAVVPSARSRGSFRR